MRLANGLKLTGLIVGVAITDIAVLSPGLLGIEIGGGNAMETASGTTLLIMSVLVLCYGAFRFLYEAAIMPSATTFKTHDDYIAALQAYRGMKGLKRDIVCSIDQLNRLQRKKRALIGLLEQHFDRTELSFRKFAAVIAAVEKLFYNFIRGILHKAHVFDASSLSGMEKKSGRTALFSERLISEKRRLYDDYLGAVKGYLSANEEILLKLDQLLLEISRLGYAKDRNVEELPCMQEIDTLIKQTSFYQS
ncbi:hypothetical protein [Paenibacillus sp. HB172176]|uniref:hypothetical protein n=1 Tax=Paenibacillus sp. HB172176 TaxID=2493690 RepID=UPI001438D86B|nr:hypothetical protein [Paenibacillus sp. HB172176]